MKVAVVGGGASGLMAAYAAATNGHEVVLVEKNEKLGKKIYITGKGRCNLTNDCPPDEFLLSVVRGEKFLRGAVYRFPPSAVMELLTEHGLALKTERGNRVFPVSDHASDVTNTLVRACNAVGVRVLLKLCREAPPEVRVQELKGLDKPGGPVDDAVKAANRLGVHVLPP